MAGPEGHVEGHRRAGDDVLDFVDLAGLRAAIARSLEREADHDARYRAAAMAHSPYRHDGMAP